MLSAKHNKQSFNFASYKLRSSLKSKFNFNNQGIKRTYNMDPQQSNSVYRHLKRQRVNRKIFNFIIGPKSLQASQLQIKKRSYSTNFDVFERNIRSMPSRQMQRFRSKGENILHKVDKISSQVKYNKKRIGILQRYNDIIDKYCEVVPKLKTKNQKEIFVAHQQIQKICKEQFVFKDKRISTAAEHLKRFVEPKINWKVLKKNIRIATTQVPQILPGGKQKLKRANTYSF